ncbi:unnamed protein product [Rotaria sp. Silwood1]|nr:unnamed protein product [Rotaria sp. Silwood1]
MDNDGYIYVGDWDVHEVRRHRIGESQTILSASGNGQGNRLNQLSNPGLLFIDRNHSLYISDTSNHRVMKWMKGAKEGIVVAGGHGQGNSIAHLSYPLGAIVDQSGAVYVADDRVEYEIKGEY